MPAPVYAGSAYPAGADSGAAPASPPLPPPAEESAANMPKSYCLRVVTYVDESPLGVAFRSLRVLADGSISTPLWYDHATGEWSSAFDSSRHVRPLEADPTHPSLQYFAAPAEIADDPSVVADVFIRKASDGSVLSPVDSMPANHLSVLSRGWCSKP